MVESFTCFSRLSRHELKCGKRQAAHATVPNSRRFTKEWGCELPGWDDGEVEDVDSTFWARMRC